jgi:carbamate kinase
MPEGSMGPKVSAACGFAERGGFAGIGRLADALEVLEGSAGTCVAQAGRVTP